MALSFSFVRFFLLVLSVVIFSNEYVFAVTYYVDVTGGNDVNDGISIATPWKTITKVNASSSYLLPGDSVLFKRGEIWKGQNSTTLIPRSGNVAQYMIYGAYGSGEKPILTTSEDRSNPGDWTDLGGNIWQTGDTASSSSTTGSELLSNPSFDTNTSSWNFYVNGVSSAVATGVRTTTAGEFDSAPAGYKVTVTSSGGTQSDIQLYTTGIPIVAGTYYKFSFMAKVSTGSITPSISLIKSSSPYTNYANSASVTITDTWQMYNVIFRANTSASDGRINFPLGNVSSGTILYIDSLGLKESSGRFLTTDVGNIIMSNKTQFGVKVWNQPALTTQGQYWYDLNTNTLKFYSVGNPAVVYGNDITLVLRDPIVELGNKSNVILDGLGISMGGSLGISMSSSSNIIIRNCDVSYIGGSDQYMDGVRTVRYGNGIQLWEGGHDISVYNNKLWQIYDAAVSPQGFSTSTIYNVYFYNNVIWDAEYGIEYWERPAATIVDSVYFDNNTIVDSGFGWGHNQRPDGYNGRSFLAYVNSALQTNIFTRNNIFYNASEGNVKLWSDSWLPIFTLDYNHYDTHQNMVTIVSPALTYSPAQLNSWQVAYSKDIHSHSDNYSFVDYSNKNFILNSTSSDIDSGTTSLIRSVDFLNNPIYGTPDIGAYEYQPPYTIGVDQVDITAGARIYGDGKFRSLATTTGDMAHIVITPESGSFPSYDATSTRPEWLDLTNITWNKSGDYHKRWTESSELLGSTPTLHTIGDLKPHTSYILTLDDVAYGTYTSNDSGQMTFTYTGGYTTHTFDITEAPPLPSPTITSAGSGWYSSFYPNANTSNQSNTNIPTVIPSSSSTTQQFQQIDTYPVVALGISTSSNKISKQIITKVFKDIIPVASLPDTFTHPIKRGDSGGVVKRIQIILAKETKQIKARGANGIFGPITENALKDFQCRYNIVCSGTPSTTGWGVVGAKTLKVLKYGNTTTVQ